MSWICLHRSIRECDALKSKDALSKQEAFIDLLLDAGYKPKTVKLKGTLVPLLRGQQARSIPTLMEEWKWGKGKVTRFLKALEEEGMISVQGVRVTTVITILNYEKYQGFGDPKTNPQTNPQTEPKTNPQTDPQTNPQTNPQNISENPLETGGYEGCEAGGEPANEPTNEPEDEPANGTANRTNNGLRHNNLNNLNNILSLKSREEKFEISCDEETNISGWEPSENLINSIKTFGLPEKFILEQAHSYRIHWESTNYPESKWDSGFFTSCQSYWKKTKHIWLDLEKQSEVNDEINQQRSEQSQQSASGGFFTDAERDEIERSRGYQF